MKSPAITATLEGKNKTLYLQVRQYQYAKILNIMMFIIFLYCLNIKVLFVFFRPLPLLKKELDPIFAKLWKVRSFPPMRTTKAQLKLNSQMVRRLPALSFYSPCLCFTMICVYLCWRAGIGWWTGVSCCWCHHTSDCPLQAQLHIRNMQH